MPLSLQPENGHTLFFFYLCIIFYLYNICCFPPSHPTRRCNIHPAMPYFSAALYVMRCILLPVNSFLLFFSPTLRAAAKDVLQCVGESQIMTPLLASIVFFFGLPLSMCYANNLQAKEEAARGTALLLLRVK